MIEIAKIKFIYNIIFRRRGLDSFLSKLPEGSKILDIGCGNNSPFAIKTNFPGFHYTGVDIGNYNQTKPLLADKYILTTPENFATEIEKFVEIFDAVISSHNIEHCDDRQKTLKAMLGAVKPEGMLFLSFPCEASVKFPSRTRTLNYYDDKTHKDKPPSFAGILHFLLSENMSIVFSVNQYKPIFLWILGLLQEPVARAKNVILQGTWAYYGFESIIWAKKRRNEE